MNKAIVSGYTGAYQDRVGAGYPLGHGYRWFLPWLMRFNAPDDWSPFFGGGPNPYSYCGGDPINRKDPSGHVWWEAILDCIPCLDRRVTSEDISLDHLRTQQPLMDQELHAQPERRPSQLEVSHPQQDRPRAASLDSAEAGPSHRPPRPETPPAWKQNIIQSWREQEQEYMEGIHRHIENLEQRVRYLMNTRVDFPRTTQELQETLDSLQNELRPIQNDMDNKANIYTENINSLEIPDRHNLIINVTGGLNNLRIRAFNIQFWLEQSYREIGDLPEDYESMRSTFQRNILFEW
jgi:RHS repeat-associated protein